MRRARSVLSAVSMGVRSFSKRTSQFTPTRAIRPLSPGAEALTEPYHSRVAYLPEYTTPRTNPVQHTFLDAGLYYSLGETEEEVAVAFPTGFPGALGVEFQLTYQHQLLVRPLGVALVAQMEHWRQLKGRLLAGQGRPVKDLDPAVAYAPEPLLLPPTRAEALAAAAALKRAGGEAAAAEEAPAVDVRVQPAPPFRLLTGQRGIGKSGLLTYAVHYARVNGWITVVVPDCFSIVYAGKVMAPSRLRPGSFDQNDKALELLRAVLRSNGDRLQRVPQRGSYASYRYLPAALDEEVSREREALHAAESTAVATLKAQMDAEGKPWDATLFKSKYEDESDHARDRAGYTLHDMVAWGMRHPAAATDTVLALLAELRKVTEFPVLVVVDGINHLYEQGPHAMGGEDVPPERLSLQHALQCVGPEGFKLDTHSMARGQWLCAVSHRHTEDMDALFSRNFIPRSYRTPVPRLTRQELHSQLKHYKACGNFFMMEDAPEIDAFTVEYYRTLTGSVPGEVVQAAIFQPLGSDLSTQRDNQR